MSLVEAAETTIAERWRAYTARQLSPAEQTVVAQLGPIMESADVQNWRRSRRS